MGFQRLTADELPTTTIALARKLIGLVLVRKTREGLTAGRIVETEAYPLGDPASHAFAGPRPRNGAMFLGPLHAYVYLIYGRSFCFNITSETLGRGAAVLVRALEPVAGIGLMQQRRSSETVRDLCRGPGRLAQALAIDRVLDARYLPSDAEIWIAHWDRGRGPVGRSRRIGITRAAEAALRFYERGSPFVSGPRHLSP